MKIRVFALSALLMISSGAFAEDIQERTIRFGHLVNPGHPLALGVQKFSELVAEKSDGKIKVREFGGSVLGSESQQMSAVQGGIQQMFVPATTTASAIVNEFSLIDTPFAFQNTAQVDELLSGPFGDALQDRLTERGIVGMGFWETGFRNITNNRKPILKMEDMKGLKTRVMGDPLFLESFKALGVNPVPMAFGELYGALESGALDAQENPYSIVLTSKFDEVQNYMSETNHVYTANLVMMSQKFWSQLSDKEKEILSEAALEAGEYQRTISREKAQEAREQLIESGMKINALPQEELDRMRSVTDPVAANFAKNYDPVLVELYLGEMDRIRAEQL